MGMDDEEVYTAVQAAEITHVTRQAIYQAYYNDKLKGFCDKNDGGILKFKKKDLDEYRLNKYNKQAIKIDGEAVFDAEKGHFSVIQVAQVLSQELGYYYKPQRIYHLLRSGQIRGFKKGYSWVLTREDALVLLEREMQKHNPVDNQLKLFNI